MHSHTTATALTGCECLSTTRGLGSWSRWRRLGRCSSRPPLEPTSCEGGSTTATLSLARIGRAQPWVAELFSSVGELRELQRKRVCAYLSSSVGELRRTGNSRAAALIWRAVLRSAPQVLRPAFFLRLPSGAAASSAAPPPLLFFSSVIPPRLARHSLLWIPKSNHYSVPSDP